MKDNFPKALKLVLKEEGGYVNHPSDPGGATNFGVTQGTYDVYRIRKGQRTASVEDITSVEVADIYRRHYWNVIDGDLLPSGLDYALFDFAVNSGPAQAVRTLQRVVSANPDGRIGFRTMAAIKTMPVATIIRGLTSSRMNFLRGLSHWGVFKRGWTRRVLDVERIALTMVAQTPPRLASIGIDIPIISIPVNPGWFARLRKRIVRFLKKE